MGRFKTKEELVNFIIEGSMTRQSELRVLFFDAARGAIVRYHAGSVPRAHGMGSGWVNGWVDAMAFDDTPLPKHCNCLTIAKTIVREVPKGKRYSKTEIEAMVREHLPEWIATVTEPGSK